MKYQIIEETTDNKINLKEAIEREHIIGFIDTDNNKKNLIVKTDNKVWSYISTKNNESFIYFKNSKGDLQECVDYILTNSYYLITNSFDNYKDAFKWYLED